MNALFRAALDHWAIVTKILAGIFVLGMIWAKVPSSDDLDKINTNLVRILTEQRERIDRHDVAIANRLTRDDVEKMIAGPSNPWILQSSIVMPVITRYIEDRDHVRNEISDLWRAMGARRGGGK